MIGQLVASLAESGPLSINFLELDVALSPPTLSLGCAEAHLVNVLDRWGRFTNIEHVLDTQVHDLFKKQERVMEDILRGMQLSEHSIRVHLKGGSTLALTSFGGEG